MEKSQSEQQICVSESIFCIVRKTAGREGDRPVDEIQVVEILKLLCRINFSDFYFVRCHCHSTAVLELHSVGFYQVKLYFKVCFEVQKTR